MVIYIYWLETFKTNIIDYYRNNRLSNLLVWGTQEYNQRTASNGEADN